MVAKAAVVVALTILLTASYAAAAGRGLTAAQKANILPALAGKGKGAAPIQQQRFVAAMPLQQQAFVAAQPQYVVAAQPQLQVPQYVVSQPQTIVAAQPQPQYVVAAAAAPVMQQVPVPVPVPTPVYVPVPTPVPTPVYVPKPVPAKGKSHSHPLVRVAGAVAKAIEENDD